MIYKYLSTVFQFANIKSHIKKKAFIGVVNKVRQIHAFL